MKKSTSVAVLVALSLAVTACSSMFENMKVSESESHVEGAVYSGLEAPVWQLSRYLDELGQMLPVLLDTEVTARFMEGKLSGSAGCNSYFGSYTVGEGGHLSIADNMGVNQMACPPPISEQEHHYLNHLSAVVAFQLEGESLRLLDKSYKTVLEYTAVKPLMLEGTPWQAAGINNGRGGVVSTPTIQLSTAKFEDGKVSGSAGCNTFNASYEITGNQITIGPAMTTRMHCEEPDGIMDQEQEYLHALSRVRVYELTVSGLDLRDGNGALQVSFVVGKKGRQ